MKLPKLSYGIFRAADRAGCIDFNDHCIKLSVAEERSTLARVRRCHETVRIESLGMSS